MEQLQAAQLELHLIKQTEGHKLIEAEDKVKTLSRKAEMMAQMLQDIFTRLSDYEKRSGKSSCFCYDTAFSPSQLPLGPAVEKALRDLENDKHGLQEKLQMVCHLVVGTFFIHWVFSGFWHLLKHACRWIHYSKWSLDVHESVPDSLQIHHDPDHDKVLPENQW